MRFHNSEAALDLVKLVIGSGQAFVRHSVIVLTVGCVFINEGSVPGKTAFSFECLFINSFNSRLCFFLGLCNGSPAGGLGFNFYSLSLFLQHELLPDFEHCQIPFLSLLIKGQN